MGSVPLVSTTYEVARSLGIAKFAAGYYPDMDVGQKFGTRQVGVDIPCDFSNTWL